MPSKYEYGIEQFNEQCPNLPIFTDYEAIRDQLLKYWLMRESLRRWGVRGIRRKKWTPSPPHFLTCSILTNCNHYAFRKA